MTLVDSSQQPMKHTQFNGVKEDRSSIALRSVNIRPSERNRKCRIDLSLYVDPGQAEEVNSTTVNRVVRCTMGNVEMMT